MPDNHYTYRVSWSPEDNEHVATCAEFPSLSWLAADELEALRGIRRLVTGTVRDMRAAGEKIPDALADRHYSGHLTLRVPPGTAPPSCHGSGGSRHQPQPACEP